MKLKELVGKHFLSGYDTVLETYPDYYIKNIEVVRFVLDGITYKVAEDPDDGYRSFLDDITVTDEIVTNTFPPHIVICRMQDNDIIEFIDMVTGKVVLTIGTDYSLDYYPYCVMQWNPENLAINIFR